MRMAGPTPLAGVVPRHLPFLLYQHNPTPTTSAQMNVNAKESATMLLQLLQEQTDLMSYVVPQSTYFMPHRDASTEARNSSVGPRWLVCSNACLNRGLTTHGHDRSGMSMKRSRKPSATSVAPGTHVNPSCASRQRRCGKSWQTCLNHCRRLPHISDRIGMQRRSTPQLLSLSLEHATAFARWP